MRRSILIAALIFILSLTPAFGCRFLFGGHSSFFLEVISSWFRVALSEAEEETSAPSEEEASLQGETASGLSQSPSTTTSGSPAREEKSFQIRKKRSSRELWGITKRMGIDQSLVQNLQNLSSPSLGEAKLFIRQKAAYELIQKAVDDSKAFSAYICRRNKQCRVSRIDEEFSRSRLTPFFEIASLGEASDYFLIYFSPFKMTRRASGSGSGSGSASSLTSAASLFVQFDPELDSLPSGYEAPRYSEIQRRLNAYISGPRPEQHIDVGGSDFAEFSCYIDDATAEGRGAFCDPVGEMSPISDLELTHVEANSEGVLVISSASGLTDGNNVIHEIHVIDGRQSDQNRRYHRWSLSGPVAAIASSEEKIAVLVNRKDGSGSEVVVLRGSPPNQIITSLGDVVVFDATIVSDRGFLYFLGFDRSDKEVRTYRCFISDADGQCRSLIDFSNPSSDAYPIKISAVSGRALVLFSDHSVRWLLSSYSPPIDESEKVFDIACGRLEDFCLLIERRSGKFEVRFLEDGRLTSGAVSGLPSDAAPLFLDESNYEVLVETLE